jgi:hypothetical protein
MDVTNPLQSVVSVVHGRGESVLRCKPIIDVDGYATEFLNPSSAIERFIVQTTEAETSSMIYMTRIGAPPA